MDKKKEYFDTVSGEKLEETSRYLWGECVRITYKNAENKNHRVDGPSDIFYHSGGLKLFYYEQNGTLHNENGPAIVKLDSNGGAFVKEYRINGNPVTDPLQLTIIQLKEEGTICKLKSSISQT